MNKVKEMLEKAWKLIEDPKNRCIKAFARDSNGCSVEPGSPKAVCFCTAGALKAVGNQYTQEDYPAFDKAFDILRKASRILFNAPIDIANDADPNSAPQQIYLKAFELADLQQVYSEKFIAMGRKENE